VLSLWQIRSTEKLGKVSIFTLILDSMNWILILTVCFLMPCISHIYSFHFAGTFGQVLECWDRETREMVAIKVVRSIKKYREAAMIEIDVLQLLGKSDRNGSR
jgi:hypothetical protein